MSSTRPELVGSFGVVSSTHWLASQTGMAVLEAGGNAFDAAVAAGLVLQVVEPHMSGPGGEVPVLAWDAVRGAPFVVCGQGGAPRAATVEAFEALGLDSVPGAGVLPAVVPGAFGAWMLLLRDHGTLRLREVVRYAIEYAGTGFVCLPATARAIADSAELFERAWPTSRDVWLGTGGAPRAGDLLRNPDLASCLTRIVTEAEAATPDRDAQIEAARVCFYEGFVARAVDAFYRREQLDPSGVLTPGLLRLEDLATWRPTREEPVSLEHHGLTVLKTGPWAQGPVMLQQLALLEGFDLAGWGPSSVELIHTTVECAKLAFADREAWYGDPDHVDVPLATLLSRRYNDDRRTAVGVGAVVDGLHPGRPGGARPRLAHHPAVTVGVPHGSGEPLERDLRSAHRRDTCHLDVADRFGNMVSATPSGGWLQDSPVVPGLGFAISTRAQMSWLERGLANTLAPGKRPRTTLSPGLALRDGEPYLAFGTPGGDMQDQWALLMLLRHLHSGMDLQEAIEAPTWHSTHFPSSFHPHAAAPGVLTVESRVGESVIDGLRARGHRVRVEGPWSLGRTCAVSRGAGGVLRAAASPRGAQAYAAGR